MLQVGRQFDSVIRVLRWAGPGLSIDMSHIRRLANRKGSVQRLRRVCPADRTQQQTRSRETQARNHAIFTEAKKQHSARGASWTAIADAIAATDLAKAGQRRRVSAGTVRRIIAEMRRCERENFRSKHKERT